MWTIEPGWIIAAFSAMWLALTGVVTWIGSWVLRRLEKCEDKHACAQAEAMQFSHELVEVKAEMAVLKSLATPQLAATISAAVVQALKIDPE